jgi:hypothetical protein
MALPYKQAGSKIISTYYRSSKPMGYGKGKHGSTCRIQYNF